MSTQTPRFLLLTLALSLGLSAAACGINQDVHQRVLDQLAQCQTQLSECQAAHTHTKKDFEDKLKESVALHDKAQADLTEIRSNLKTTETELEALRDQRAASQKRLAAYRKLNERLREMVDTGKLKVDFRKGQMVVGLPAEILFSSGKSKLSKQGEGALEEVAKILLDFKDRRFMIAGHTDNEKVHSANFTNWHLSTARAVSVLLFLVDAGFAPENLAAVGFGEFDPIADNTTKEGRALNRRIEIILVPDLSELPKLTDEEDAQVPLGPGQTPAAPLAE